MKKNEIKIGSTYTAKITNRVVPVRIDATNPHGGWDATNLATKKKVRIKSAAKLRGVYRDSTNADPSTKVASPMSKATRANTAATDAKGKAMATTGATPARNATRANDANPDANTKSKAPKQRRSKKADDSPGGIAMAIVRNQARVNAAKRPSGLDLAAKVLAEAKEPLAAKAIAERAIAVGWQTNGQTPSATLYAAMIREIARKGNAARFKKVGRGLFEIKTTSR